MPRLFMVVLDYDQTIVDNTPDFYEAFCAALRHYNHPCIPFDEFTSLLVSNNLQHAIPEGVSPEEFFKVFRRSYVSRHSWPRPGVKEFLALLKTFNVKVVIISGRETSKRYVLFDLERHGLVDYVDDVLTLEDLILLGFKESFLFDKSQLISYAKQKYGVAGEVICIGDYITDYLSCIKVGGIFIGINKYVERNRYLERAGVKFLAKDFYEAALIVSSLGLFS
jgi:phosphoglycolate phosphatase